MERNEETSSRRELVRRRALSAAAGLARGPRRRVRNLALVSGTALMMLACLPEKDTGGSLETSDTQEESTGVDSETAATETETGESEGETVLTDATDFGSGTDGMSSVTTDTTGVTTMMETDSDATMTATQGDTEATTQGETDTTTDGLSDCMNEIGEVDWDCCAEQDWQPQPQCAAWGPPAPPRARVVSPRVMQALADAMNHRLV
ncbi:MAG: hypothetical protein ACPG4T_04210 [Nannocystaceae bacterium]